MRLGVAAVGGQVGSNSFKLFIQPVDFLLQPVDSLIKPRLDDGQPMIHLGNIRLEFGSRCFQFFGLKLLTLGKKFQLVTEGIFQRTDPTRQHFIDLVQKLFIHLPLLIIHY